MKLQDLKVSPDGVVEAKYINGIIPWRVAVCPGDTINQAWPQEVKDACASAHTASVISAFKAPQPN